VLGVKSPDQLETLLMPTHRRFGFDNQCGLIFLQATTPTEAHVLHIIPETVS
jgi:hypothetical protein